MTVNFLLAFSFVLWYHNKVGKVFVIEIFWLAIAGKGGSKKEFFSRLLLLGVGPLYGHIFPLIFYPISSFVIESYIYETDFTLGLNRKYHF